MPSGVVSGAGDRVYARGNSTRPRRPASSARAKPYIDPDTKEFLGINADDIGSGEIVAEEGDVGTMVLTRSTQEVRLGDRLFATEERPINSTFMPSEPAGEVNGVILDAARRDPDRSVRRGDHQQGGRDGLKEGNVLAIYKTGETVRDRVTGESVKIPDERAGLLMVFCTLRQAQLRPCAGGLALVGDPGQSA